jgi:alpha-galactosidase
LILDYGRPEVVEYIEAVLGNLLDGYAIDFIKWDMNRNATEPGSAVGPDIWWRHTAAVYGIMDRVRSRHPALQIESCSGGGGRIDLGILGRTDHVWTSDNTDALDRIRIQEGFSLAYPARTMESWVTHAANHQTHRVSTLGTRFDVAMRGALGIGSNLNELSEAELAEYAAYIAFYKRIRHIVQGGRLFRLQRLEEYQASVVEYVLSDASEAVYSVVTRDYQIGWTRPPAPLRGLDATAQYVAFDRDQQPVLQATGFDLMTFGIPLTSFGRPGDSKTLHLRRH